MNRFTKSYSAKTPADARNLFLADAETYKKKGYYPISEDWQPGSYGCGAFLLALLLCFILVGFLVFIYMIIVKPNGRLAVVYEEKSIEQISAMREKTCPACAETIKEAAMICRFCGHSFDAISENEPE